MATFTATANTDTTIGFTLSGYAAWNMGPENGARQGAIPGMVDGESYVGLIIFDGVGAELKGKDIKSISLAFTVTNSGTQSGDLTLTIHKSNYQSLEKKIYGKYYVGDTLGTLTGNHNHNTTTYALDETNNTALFNAFKDYLAEGNSAIVLYNGLTNATYGGLSNYCLVTSCTLTVTLSGGETVWYCNGGKWVECWAHYYNKDKWVKCASNRHNGKEWEKV